MNISRCFLFLAGAAGLLASPADFDIPAQPAPAGVTAFSRQAGAEVLFAHDELAAHRTNAVRGRLEPADALGQLLARTGLAAQRGGNGKWLVARAPATADPAPVPAAPTPPPAAPTKTDATVQMEAFQVTAIGQRFVNLDALQAKRAAWEISDSIAQDDIGKLPDVNIADSFRRIPGISTLNDEDEGRFVVARGLAPGLNHVTLDGMALATHDAFGGGGRSVNLETIPAGAVRRLEAFKTFLPSMDGGSIGSYLNLRTRSTADRADDFLTIGAQAGYFSQRAVPARRHPLSTRLQATVARTFGARRQFGLLVSAEDFRKSRDQEKIIQDTYNYFNAAGASTGSPRVGNGFAAPGQFRWYSYNNDLVRTGLNAKFEYKPAGGFRSQVSVYRFRQSDDEDRFGHMLISLAGMSNQTATSGTYATGRGEVSYTHNDIRRALDGAHWHAEFAPEAGAGRLAFDVAWSGTAYRNDTPFIGFRTPVSPQLGIDYDSRTLVQYYRFRAATGADYFGDARNYTLDNYNYRALKTEEYVTHAKLAYAYNDKADRGPFGFAVGGDFKRLDRRVNNDRWNYANPAFRLSSAPRALSYVPPARAEPFLFLDERAFETSFQRGAGPGFVLTQPGSFEQSREADFRYVEEIRAGYAMGTWQTGRWRAAGGWRYEDVAADAQTFRRLVAPVPDEFVPITVPTGYRNALPSATGGYELTDRLWLRAGLSRSVGRPDPSDIATLQRISADGLNITRGNPALKPRDARNYDVSLEYYFPRADGIVSLALFRKEIADDIFDLTTQETVGGILANVRQPTNASSSRIQGLEFGLVRNHLPFFGGRLKNFGFTGNVTVFDTAFNYVNAAGVRFARDTLLLQPKWNANAAFSYEWANRAEVRLAYDYKDRYLSGLNADRPWLNEGWKAYGQWDLTLRYRFGKQLHLDASVRNLGNAHRQHVRGENLELLHEDVDFGSSYWLGVTFRQ